jgi:hypothetical protein
MAKRGNRPGWRMPDEGKKKISQTVRNRTPEQWKDITDKRRATRARNKAHRIGGEGGIHTLSSLPSIQSHTTVSNEASGVSSLDGPKIVASSGARFGRSLPCPTFKLSI